MNQYLKRKPPKLPEGNKYPEKQKGQREAALDV